MQQSHLIVLTALLLFVGLLYFAGFLTGSAEGFANSTCPVGYSFFTNSSGTSMCCKGGTINPYTNQCERNPSAEAEFALCAFAPNIPDPTRPSQMLRLCSDVAAIQQANAGSGECPAIYPNYAVENAAGSAAKCCKSATATKLDGNRACSSQDIATGSFCIARGSADATKGERLCTEINTQVILKNASCGAGYNKFDYTFGSGEIGAYSDTVAGVRIPVCTNIESTCLPKESIAYAQKYGAFKAIADESERKKWKFSCDYNAETPSAEQKTAYLIANPSSNPYASE